VVGMGERGGVDGVDREMVAGTVDDADDDGKGRVDGGEDEEIPGVAASIAQQLCSVGVMQI
jgi:hypothetical protein